MGDEYTYILKLEGRVAELEAECERLRAEQASTRLAFTLAHDLAIQVERERREEAEAKCEKLRIELHYWQDRADRTYSRYHTQDQRRHEAEETIAELTSKLQSIYVAAKLSPDELLEYDTGDCQEHLKYIQTLSEKALEHPAVRRVVKETKHES